MADIQILKTNDIDKVPIKANQLIFCKDSSFYFDYDNHTRLRNVGVGTQLANFKPGTLYDKNDIIVVDGYIFRANERFTSSCYFEADKWTKVGVGDGEVNNGTAVLVAFNNENTELTATNVQSAIDELYKLIADIDLQIGEI